MSRARLPAFATETRRTSASNSGETTTSSVVLIVPSRRENSARSRSMTEAVESALKELEHVLSEFVAPRRSRS